MYTFCVQLEVPAPDGKSYAADYLNTEAAFRIVQSIPSTKVEPFKPRSDHPVHECPKETENPELLNAGKATPHFNIRG